MLLEHWALNRSQAQLDLCDCYVSRVWIKKNVAEILCYLGNLYIYKYIFFSFFKDKLCSSVYLSDILCRQCEVTKSSFTPTLGCVMSWHHTQWQDPSALCFAIVFTSLPRSSGTEESEMGHEMMQGTWMLPASWQGPKTPCATWQIGKCSVVCVALQAQAPGTVGQGHWKLFLELWGAEGHWKLFLELWGAEFKACTAQPESCRKGDRRSQYGLGTWLGGRLAASCWRRALQHLLNLFHL